MRTSSNVRALDHRGTRIYYSAEQELRARITPASDGPGHSNVIVMRTSAILCSGASHRITKYHEACSFSFGSPGARSLTMAIALFARSRAPIAVGLRYMGHDRGMCVEENATPHPASMIPLSIMDGARV